MKQKIMIREIELDFSKKVFKISGVAEVRKTLNAAQIEYVAENNGEPIEKVRIWITYNFQDDCIEAVSGKKWNINKDVSIKDTPNLKKRLKKALEIAPRQVKI